MTQIQRISAPLPTCKINLMPFHLNQDGPAPISTYFMVDAAKEMVGAPSATQVTDSTVPETQDDTTGSKPNVSSDIDGHLPSCLLKDKTAEASTSKNRFASTFRGRIIQGLNVELPTGYVGLVLKPGESSEGERKNGRNEREEGGESSTGRVTRDSSKARGEKKSKKSLEEEQEEHGIPPDFDGNVKRILVPTSSFSSFVIWHPDIPVDEGRDEYYRSLKEWTQLASVLHREE
ncbi:hypothetical protein BDN71DRAFT_1444233 [Pleurotus eryngii]|uniref:Uncharacterized protein n=1 Tax=Pleurotus eryngii TaxID=5323 RepID=A0A9P6A414_PLEER|nr:hypothetical protein BDN71DRAFT_1444233 [Pleurotus eryngii]